MKKIQILSLFLSAIFFSNVISAELDDHDETNKDDEINSEKIIKITKENFLSTLNQPEIGTFVMFYAPW